MGGLIYIPDAVQLVGIVNIHMQLEGLRGAREIPPGDACDCGDEDGGYGDNDNEFCAAAAVLFPQV